MEATRNSNPWALASGLSVLSVATLVGGAIFVVSALKPRPVDEPKRYAQFKASDNTFQCQYPDGWKKKSSSAQGVRSLASFKKGGAGIVIDANDQGSFMGDIASLGGGGMVAGVPGLEGAAAGARKAPVETVHETSKGSSEDLMSLAGASMAEYEEQSPKPFRTAMGEGRVSEFKAKGGMFTGELHGYRATILGSDKAYNIVCWAPESDWPKVNKAFQQVIGSVSPAAGR
jgi:hypothetical protein